MAKSAPPMAASPTATSANPRRGAPLSEEEIVAAALALVAEAGVEALTMRALSDRLGVALGATYKYVANKRVLIELLVTELFSRVQETDTGSGDWQARIRALFLQVYETFCAYPGLAWQITLRPDPPTRPPDLLDTLTKVLAGAGFAEQAAQDLMLALMYYTTGGILVASGAVEDPVGGFATGLDLLLAGARTQLGR